MRLSSSAAAASACRSSTARCSVTAPSGRVTEVVLHDIDAARLARDRPRAGRAGAGTAGDGAGGHSHHRPRPGARGADFVFSAIRVGGLEGRAAVDERVALDLGVLGQETTGAGGVAYGLRTVPVAVRHRPPGRRARARRLGHQLHQPGGAGDAGDADGARRPGDRHLRLAARARPPRAGALGLDLGDLEIDYAGLNHLGWLRGCAWAAATCCPSCSPTPPRSPRSRRGSLFGAELAPALGAIPNEYLYYYYFTRDAIAADPAGDATRGEFLLAQQADFYAGEAPAAEPRFERWEAAGRERNATYMAETREARRARRERARPTWRAGGYERVALALMRAIARDEPRHPDPQRAQRRRAARAPRRRRRRGALPGRRERPHPAAVDPLPGHALGLVQQVKAVDELVIRAVGEGSRSLAAQAIALHPLVDSVTVAREPLTGYQRRLPDHYAGLA